MLPPTDNEPVRLWELVHAFCLKTSIPADRGWGMTVADLVLTILPNKEENSTAHNRVEQMMICNRIDERQGMLDRLTFEERLELEEYKSRVM